MIALTGLADLIQGLVNTRTSRGLPDQVKAPGPLEDFQRSDAPGTTPQH